ncbi:hypothetical protein ACFQ08_24765, partial [Streptosporangium algeriense]
MADLRTLAARAGKTRKTGRSRPHLVSGPATGVLLAVLASALVVALALGVSVGSVTLPFGQVWSVVWAHLSGHGDQADPALGQVVWEIRTPRALLSALAGDLSIFADLGL